MERSSHYLAEELKKQCDETIYNGEGYLPDIIENLEDKPDFILLNDCFAPKLCPPIYGIAQVNIPKGIIFHDLTVNILERKKYFVQNRFDYVFSHYRDAFLKRYPRLTDKMIWLPHHADINVFKDYNLDKKINWLLMGATEPMLYPLRAIIKGQMNGWEGFVYHPHPGYRHEDEIEPGSLIAEDYAKEINRAKMFMTSDSILRYPVMKYFEVLACNTLLLASASNELEDLGFVDEETFVAINKYNFKEKAVYYLQNEEERIRIARNGFEMVKKNHSTEKRAGELIQHIKRIIEEKK